MKKGLFGILIGALLLPALFAVPVLAQEPTHPDVSATYGSFNCSRARMWAVDLATWQRSVYYDWIDISIGGQDGDLLSGIQASFVSPRHEVFTTCSYGIGAISPLSLRQSLRRMFLIGFDADVEEQGSGDAMAYMGLFRLRYYRDGRIRDARGPIIGIVRDGLTETTTVFMRNVSMTWNAVA